MNGMSLIIIEMYGNKIWLYMLYSALYINYLIKYFTYIH